MKVKRENSARLCQVFPLRGNCFVWNFICKVLLCHYVVSDFPRYLFPAFRHWFLTLENTEENQSLLHIKQQWSFLQLQSSCGFSGFLETPGVGNSLWPSLEFLAYLLFSFEMCPTWATEGLKILWKSLIFSVRRTEEEVFAAKFLDLLCAKIASFCIASSLL